MFGPAIGMALGAESRHGRIDLLEGMYPHLLQLAEKVRQEQAAGGRIITGPVVLKGRQL